MNVHLPAILMFTRGTRFLLPYTMSSPIPKNDVYHDGILNRNAGAAPSDLAIDEPQVTH